MSLRPATQKLIFSLFFLISPALCFCQSDSTYVLRGNVKNYDQTYFSLVQDGFLDWKDYNIVVNNKGDFFKKISTESLQDFILELNGESYTFFARPGDTITMNWDQANFNKTFSIEGNSKGRTVEYQMILALNALSKTNEKETDTKVSDTTKFNRLNTAYNQEMKLISDYPGSENFDKIAYDVYYKYMNRMHSGRLIEKFKLGIIDQSVKDAVGKNIPLPFLNYKLLNELAFNKSASYRKFVYDWIRLYQIFNGTLALDKTEQTTNFVKYQYLMGQAVINVRRIKDWFGAMVIKDGFEDSEYLTTLAVYNRYLLETEESALKKKLIKYYTNLKNLSVGQPAPGFTLKDMNSKLVSLLDFHGKIVYVDFWGVHCGPCRGDILDNAAKVHEKYKGKDVVFLNICTDETEQPWKKAIASLKLDGVNLITETADDSGVVKDYNINSLPRYVLIGKDGNIISSAAPGLWELVTDRENLLDAALKK